VLSIIEEEGSDRSFAGIVTIEDSPQNLSKNDYQTQLVSLLRDLLQYMGPSKIRTVVSELLTNDHSILRRLAIHLINYYYEEMKNIFWNWGANPIEDYRLKHEIYELFRKNCRKFTDKQLARVVEWIETESRREYYALRRTPAEEKKAEAYHKKEWLSSIMDSNDKRVTSLFKEYDKINSAKLEHPGYLIWFSGVKVSGPEPLDSGLISKTNEEIAAHLVSRMQRELKSQEIELLRSSFRTTVRENSQKFSSDLKPFSVRTPLT